MPRGSGGNGEESMDAALEKGIDRVISMYREITGLECYHYTLADFSEKVQMGEDACAFCRLVRRSQHGRAACTAQLSAAIMPAIKDDSWKVVVCHSGLVDWLVPVFYGGVAEGVLISGFICNGEEAAEAIRSQKEFLAVQADATVEEMEAACEKIRVVEKMEVKHLARLLNDLRCLCIPSGRNIPEKIEYNKNLLNCLEESEEDAQELPKGQALSEVIYSPSFARGTLAVFWKRVENKAESVFANIMSKRIAAAYKAYSEIMELAWAEKTPLLAMISAEMLFRIIILTRYTDTSYDTRFYALAYRVLKDGFEAKTFDQVKALMEEVFNEMCSFLVADPLTVQQDPIVVSVMEFLEQNYQKNIKIEDVARSVHMSPTYISRMFKKETSFTIKWCLNNIRMQHAQELLVHTNIPVKDIGPAVGYNDMRGFYKMFAKHFGITCTEVRKNSTV